MEYFQSVIPSAWRVTHYKDIVPHLPPKGDFWLHTQYYHEANEVSAHHSLTHSLTYSLQAYQAKDFSGMESITLCYTGESDECADQWKDALSAMDHLEYLGLPMSTGC